MILSDRDIREHMKSGRLIIEGFVEEKMQPAWVDLSLGNEFRMFRIASKPFIDVRNPHDHTELFTVEENDQFIIHPREFILGQTKERISLPDDLAAYVDGRSSLGRIGIVVHVTAGFVNPGFAGRLVLEMTNVGKMPVAIYPGMSICKLVFFKLTSPSEVPYNKKKDAKYMNQESVGGSQLYKEFK